MSNSLEINKVNNSDKIIAGEDGIAIYKSYSAIPENLKSAKYLSENGLIHNGVIVGRAKYMYYDYFLYDINTATKSDEPVKPKKEKKVYKKRSKSKPDYTSWDDVPENLCDSARLKRKGLRHNNVIEGTALIDGKFYYLYNIDTAIDINEIPEGLKVYETKNKAPKKLEGVNYFLNRGIRHNGIIKGFYKSSGGFRELYDKNKFVIEDKEKYNNFCKNEQSISNTKKKIDWKEVIDDINKNPDKYVVLDTETTGRLYHDEIVQLSIVDLEGNILFNSYFKPKVKISKGATECNGITMDDVKNAPTWSSKWNEISSILKDKVLIAYNAYFDEKLIRQTCSNHYIQIDFELNRLCAMRYTNHKCTYLKSNSKLVDVVSYLGMDFDKNNAHEALFDTYACLYIINPDAEVFKKRDLVKKYYDIMLKYDVKNVGHKQRMKEGDNWLKTNFRCSQNTLNNITIETCDAIIDKLEKFILKNNLL